MNDRTVCLHWMLALSAGLSPIFCGISKDIWCMVMLHASLMLPLFHSLAVLLFDFC